MTEKVKATQADGTTTPPAPEIDSATTALIGGAADPFKIDLKSILTPEDLTSREMGGAFMTSAAMANVYWMNIMLYYHSQSSLLTGASLYFVGTWYAANLVERVFKPKMAEHDVSTIQRNEMFASWTWIAVSIAPHMTHGKFKYTGKNLGFAFMSSTFFSIKYAWLNFSLASFS